MKARTAILFVLSVLAASPAHAEKLLFDHQLYPQIGAVLDSGRKEMVIFDDRNPKYVFDRIAIQGNSAENWTEALEIIVRVPEKTVKSPSDWVQVLGAATAANCTSQITPIAEDETSLTFMRQAPACAGAAAETALYRIVAGRKSLFLLGARYKGAMDPAMRERWLSVLASARVEN
ncbi:MAG: hypothetical protein JWQ16_318 [Novosphingobium sp.]|nr:hypothetical protein [Novosphingobium sp.]